MAKDPNFSSVSLLLHCDGANGSGIFTDSSSSPKTVTPVGDAKISTAQSKFGGASAVFDGSGDYLSVISPGLALASADHTVEMMVWMNSSAGVRRGLFFNGNTGSNLNRIQCEVLPDGYLSVWLEPGTPGGVAFTSAAAFPVGAWTHVAYTKQGSTVRLFVAGTLVASGTYAPTIIADNGFYVGITRSGGVLHSMSGYIDEVRVTLGVARYTAAFAPPVEAFGGFGALSGVVTDASGVNAARLVRAMREDTGAFIGSAMSSATTGAYAIAAACDGGHTLIAYPDAGESLPALTLRGVVPA